MITLFSAKTEIEHFTCCNWGKSKRIIYTEDERFAIDRSSWFTSLCCTCCEKVRTNERTWEAFKRSVGMTYGKEVAEQAFQDPEVQKLMKLRRSLTTDIFKKVVQIADHSVRRDSPSGQREPNPSPVSQEGKAS